MSSKAVTLIKNTTVHPFIARASVVDIYCGCLNQVLFLLVTNNVCILKSLKKGTPILKLLLQIASEWQ